MESKILAGLKFDPGILIIGMLVLMLLMLIYIFQLHKKQNQLDKKYRAFMRWRQRREISGWSAWE